MDPSERRDGFVFGMMTRLYFDPKQNKKGGVEVEILRRHCRMPESHFRQSLANLRERGMVAPGLDPAVYCITPEALSLVQSGWRGGVTP